MPQLESLHGWTTHSRAHTPQPRPRAAKNWKKKFFLRLSKKRKWKEWLRCLLKTTVWVSHAKEDTQINSTGFLPIWAPRIPRELRSFQYKGEGDYATWKVWMWVIRRGNQTHPFIIHSSNIYWVLLIIQVPSVLIDCFLDASYLSRC